MDASSETSLNEAATCSSSSSRGSPLLFQSDHCSMLHESLQKGEGDDLVPT